MKGLLLVALALSCAGTFAEEPFAAVRAVVGRLAGGYDGASADGADRAKAEAAMARFAFVEDATVAPGAAVVGPANGQIAIRAADAGGAVFGLGQYLRHTAKMHVSWCGNRVGETWPLPTETATYAPAVPVRFAYNYCTLSYTMAFWSAAEWREEIDRLALSGYNVALVLQGLQEAWRVTLESVKNAAGERVFSDEQILRYVSDEAAQAWWHMGNLEGLGGPLGGEKGDYSAPDAYAKFKARTQADAELGAFIYREMMKLGIQPSIQSFVGLVPDCSNQVLADGVAADGTRFGDAPNWGIINEGAWQGYTRPDVVNPLNVAFDELSKAWYGALVAIYRPAENGYTHYMGGDLFHEGGNKGPLTDAQLAQIAAKIQKTQNDYFGNGDPDGVTWVLQSWQGSPYQGIRNGLDCKKALIQLLDKDMSTTGGVGAGYWNNTTGEHIPWIWVEVLNFGGNTGLHGGARRFRNLAKIGTAAGHAASFRGYGILSEGLETNPMMYDMFNDAFTRDVGQDSSIDENEIKSWTRAYCERRYGLSDANLEAAYGVLLGTVFDCSRYQEGCVENMLCAGPDAAVAAVSKWGPKGGIEYDPAKLYPAAYAFLDAAREHPELLALETFRYDFVELFLQLIGERGRLINADLVRAGAKRDLFLRMFDLAERLTASSDRWRLDWHEARTTTTCPDGAGVRGYRRMVTSWADGYAAGQATGLREYAHRAYAGLLKDYYLKRWQAWFRLQDGAITAAQYTDTLAKLDAAFPTATLETTPSGDLVAIGTEILELLNPPALTLDLTDSENTWDTTGKTWTDTKGEKVVWIDGYDVNLSGVGTLTAREKVTTGNLALGASQVTDTATYAGFLPKGAENAVRLFEGITAEQLAQISAFRGTMDGGWVARGEARSYRLTVDEANDRVSFQMQRVDDGYLKSVKVVCFRDATGTVWGYAESAGNISGGVLGADVTGTGTSVATSESANGYGIRDLAVVLKSDLTLRGPIAVAGTLSVAGGRLAVTEAQQVATATEVVLDGGTLVCDSAEDLAVATLAVADPTSRVELKGTGTLVLKSLSLGANTLVFAGSAPEPSARAVRLTGENPGRGKLFYTDGHETIPLVVGTDGFLLPGPRVRQMSGWISKTPCATGFTGVGLADLGKYIISGTMDGGFVPTSTVQAYCERVTETSVNVQMQVVDGGFLKVVDLVFTEADGELMVAALWVRNRSGAALGTDCTDLANSTNWGNPDVVTDTASNGYGIYGLTLTPAEARADATGVRYASFAAAVVAENAITLLTDVDYTGARLEKDLTITIPRGVTLSVDTGANDPFHWGHADVFNVYGTLDLGARYQSVAGTKGFAVNLYAGGTIVSTAGAALSVYEPSTIRVLAAPGAEVATLKGGLKIRAAVTLDVAEGVTLAWDGNPVAPGADESTSGELKLVKTGAGTLAFAGANPAGYPLVVAEGVFSAALASEAQLVLTKAGGSAAISSADEDYEIVTVPEVEPEQGEVTFLSQGIIWLCYVTDPGETGQNGPGRRFRSYEEAKAYALALRQANPGQTVKMWTVVANESHLTLPEGITTSASPNGNEIVGWDEPVRYYYTSEATYWKASTPVSAIAGGSVEAHTVASGDIVRFDRAHAAAPAADGSIGPLYICGLDGSADKVVCTEIEIVGGTTLQVGFADGLTSIPKDWTVDIAAGSSLVFRNWGEGKGQVQVPAAQFNGEGTVTFHPETAGIPCVFGTVSGSATVVVPAGVTLRSTGHLENPLAGAGTVEVADATKTYTILTADWTGRFELVETGAWRTAVVDNGDGRTSAVSFVRIASEDLAAFGKTDFWHFYFTGAVGDWSQAGVWSVLADGALVAWTDADIPQTSGSSLWQPVLVNGNLLDVACGTDGYRHISVSALEGWNFRLGAANGVAVDLAHVNKLQADGTNARTQFFVDATSRITVGEIGRNDETPADYFVAAADGLVLARTMNNAVDYHLSGEGTVRYLGNFDNGTHRIAAVDVELGTGPYRKLVSRKLVTLKDGATNTATVTVDAAGVTDLTAGEAVTVVGTALDGSEAVGTCAVRVEASGPSAGVYLDYIARADTPRQVRWISDRNVWGDRESTEENSNRGQALVLTGDGRTIETPVQADDVMVFDDPAFASVLYLKPAADGCTGLQATRQVVVKDGVTLKLGFANNAINIPDGFTFTLEGSARLVLTVWGTSAVRDIRIGQDVTINGGTVALDTACVKNLSVGSLAGTSRLEIPTGVVVKVEDACRLPLAGAGTVKMMGQGILSASADWTGTVDYSQVVARDERNVVGLLETANPDGSRTLEVTEVADEIVMVSGGNLPEGTYADPFGRPIAWSDIATLDPKKPIVLRDDFAIHYFGETTGYDFIVRDADIYCMNASATSTAFAGSTVTVESGSLNFISREGLDPKQRARNWAVSPAFADVTLVAAGGAVKFLSDNGLPLVIKDGKTLTLEGDLGAFALGERIVGETGTLMLDGWGDLVLVGANRIGTVRRGDWGTEAVVKLAADASLVTESATLSVESAVEGMRVTAKTEGRLTTYALAPAKVVVDLADAETPVAPEGTDPADIEVTFDVPGVGTVDLHAEGFVSVAIGPDGVIVVTPTVAARPELATDETEIAGERVAPMTVVTADGETRVSLVVTKPVPGLVYAVEESADLATWTLPEGAVQRRATGEDALRLEARPSTAAQRFYRIVAKARPSA